MDKNQIEQLLYKQMYAYKYMIERKDYTFNEYASTVAAIASREIEAEIKEEEDV
jgi:hypothetical protein